MRAQCKLLSFQTVSASTTLQPSDIALLMLRLMRAGTLILRQWLLPGNATGAASCLEHFSAI